MNRLEREIRGRKASQARRESNNEDELFARMRRFAETHCRPREFDEDRVRHIAHELLGEVRLGAARREPESM